MPKERYYAGSTEDDGADAEVIGGRRRGGQRVGQRPKGDAGRLLAELAGMTDQEAGFTTTYTPARFEEGWLLSSLRFFYDQQMITDVLAQVKGGKEANVYRCAGHVMTGQTLLAAKVYRPRQFRNLRNDKMYREGRVVLTAEGRAVKATDQRIMRALGKKTAFGEQVQHTSWLMYEYTTLERLYAAGAAVPRPFAAAENAILMGYVGDARGAAPALHAVSLEPAEAGALFEETLRNIELMLQHGLIHGDLSPYNVLYWEGRLTLIDFPQVTSSATNPHARDILARDVTRMCDYFQREGVDCDAEEISDDLWARYGVEPEPLEIEERV